MLEKQKGKLKKKTIEVEIIGINLENGLKLDIVRHISGHITLDSWTLL